MDDFKLPEHFAEVLQQVCAADAAHLQYNAGQREYIRPYIDGEFWPLHAPGDDAEVWVTMLPTGETSRLLLDTPGAYPGAEAAYRAYLTACAV